MKKRLIAYVRVSRVGDRDEIRSPELQERAIRAYCEMHGFEIVEVVVDLDSSGAKVGRKKLRAIIEKILSHEVDGIAVFNLDRLARLAPKDRGTLLDEIEDEGGMIVSSTEGHDWSTPEARFMREIFLAVARLEWERKAGNFDVAKHDTVMTHGVHQCGTVPFGYLRGATKRDKLVVDTSNAKIVARAFKLASKPGSTIGDVIRFLESETDGGWYHWRVKRLLTNRAYIGEARQGKYVNPDAHKAIVDETTFAIVQAKYPESATPGARTDRKHVLSGLARCETCGYTLERNHANGGSQAFVYRCKGRSAKGMCGARVSVSAPAAEDYVWERVIERMLANETTALAIVADEESAEDVAIELAAAQRKLEPFTDPEYIALIGKEAAKAGAAKVREEIDGLQAKLAEVNRKRQEQPPKVADVLARELTPAEKNEIISGEVASVTVRRVPRLTPIAERIEIHYLGDAGAPVVPSRGRPKVNRNEEPAGELAA